MEKHSKSIVIDRLTKDFVSDKGSTVRAVDNVSIEFKEGEFTTLLGPSGCGKTTILRMIAGFEIPTSGEILIGDEEVSRLTPDKRDTAMVFQNYALFPHLNIFDNIAYGLKLRKLSPEVIKEKVDRIMSLINLEGYGSREPNKLSGGQQQRVALARALVMEPSVLLFDEPLSNLDAKLRISMRNEIRKIQQQFGTTAVYVTHDQAEAMSISDNIIIMRDGLIEQVGSPTEIYQYPASSFVADFIGQANILDGVISQASDTAVELKFDKYRVQVGVTSPLEVGSQVKAIVRPESVTLQDEGTYKVKVLSSVYMGNYQDYVIQFDNQTINIQENNPRFKHIYQVGDVAFINLDQDNIHLVSK